jgi:alanine dehydrogenase
VDLLNLGVIGTSLKENEKRVAIHPLQIEWIPEDIRKHLFFEKGYGLPFDVEDSTIKSLTGGIQTREQILNESDVVIIPKPVQLDFETIKKNTTMWGWMHCVQQFGYTQAAIDKKLTLIAWENMYAWGPCGEQGIHIFHKNNEIAGYAGVLHALTLIGKTASYGPASKVVVFSFGSVSRGAIHALKGLGYKNIHVFTLRPPRLAAHQIPGIMHRQLIRSGAFLTILNDDGSSHPLIDELSSSDIIVNGTLQNTDNPLMYVKQDQVDKLKAKSIIIDISCDKGMGFPFAEPTTFEKPILKIREGIVYYAVDHTPSYLWDSASWEISKSLIHFIPIVMGGQQKWNKDKTIQQSIDINAGIVQNKKILSFQKRSSEYPHRVE